MSPPQSRDSDPRFLLQPQPISYSRPFSQAQHCQQNPPVALVTPFSCLLKSISLKSLSSGSNRQTDRQTDCEYYQRKAKLKCQSWPRFPPLSCKYLLWFSTSSKQPSGEDCIGESVMKLSSSICHDKLDVSKLSS